MGLKIYGKFMRLLLEAEVAPTSESEFVQQYAAITGEDPRRSGYMQQQPNKWGIEARIYFDCEDWVCDSMRKLGYTVEDRPGGGYRAEFAYRINSQELFWHLVRHGYRLGENEPIEAT